MKLNVYAIFDHKAKFYACPFYQQNDAVALRTATDLLANPETEVARHPADYAMFKLGTYDDSNAKMELYPSPEHFLSFHELPQTGHDDIIVPIDDINKLAAQAAELDREAI